ncbi:MAG TPA: pirin family protein, partial [Methylibium sp.]
MSSAIALLLHPQSKDLGGGLMVRRALPAAARQAVGPFLFFDHFGPITAGPADDHDVRPHPHIGLATVTYLFEGTQIHRDSTGVVQRIEPGAVNWMTAGRGVVHSERTPPELRQAMRVSHGLQLWAGLPEADEELEPSFSHTAASEIPAATLGEVQARLLIGEAFGLRSPVPTRSPTLYIDFALPPGAAVRLPGAAQERAIYSVDAGVLLDDAPLAACAMAVLHPDSEPMLQAPQGARVVMIGGAPLG